MRKWFKIFILPLLVLFLLAGTSMAYTIVDDYIGAAPTASSYTGLDVIGAGFDIFYMDVAFELGVLDVKIYTEYTDNIGKLGTGLGDLFISTDGWNPHGTSPYLTDQYSNGEDWEYVLHITGTDTLALYAVVDDHIQLSHVDNPSYIFRAGQEVRYAPDSGENVLATGALDVNRTDDYLWFSIAYDFGDSLAFHWAETCGNDVIEGAAPVPEPATMLLFATGVIGLAGVGRRQVYKK